MKLHLLDRFTPYIAAQVDDDQSCAFDFGEKLGHSRFAAHYADPRDADYVSYVNSCNGIVRSGNAEFIRTTTNDLSGAFSGRGFCFNRELVGSNIYPATGPMVPEFHMGQYVYTSGSILKETLFFIGFKSHAQRQISSTQLGSPGAQLNGPSTLEPLRGDIVFHPHSKIAITEYINGDVRVYWGSVDAISNSIPEAHASAPTLIDPFLFQAMATTGWSIEWNNSTYHPFPLNKAEGSIIHRILESWIDVNRMTGDILYPASNVHASNLIDAIIQFGDRSNLTNAVLDMNTSGLASVIMDDTFGVVNKGDKHFINFTELSDTNGVYFADALSNMLGFEVDAVQAQLDAKYYVNSTLGEASETLLEVTNTLTGIDARLINILFQTMGSIGNNQLPGDDINDMPPIVEKVNRWWTVVGIGSGSLALINSSSGDKGGNNVRRG